MEVLLIGWDGSMFALTGGGCADGVDLEGEG